MLFESFQFKFNKTRESSLRSRSVVTALRKLRRKIEFEARVGHTVRLSQEKKKEKEHLASMQKDLGSTLRTEKSDKLKMLE